MDCLTRRSPLINCDNFKDTSKTFRTVEGFCNNLKHPAWGSTNTRLRRIIRK